VSICSFAAVKVSTIFFNAACFDSCFIKGLASYCFASSFDGKRDCIDFGVCSSLTVKKSDFVEHYYTASDYTTAPATSLAFIS